MKTYKNLFSTFKKILLFIFISAIFLPTFSCENHEKETPTKTKITQKNNKNSSKIANEILTQEKAWASALVANDLQTVDSIMHDNFSLKRIYGDDPSITKEMYLGMKGMSVSSAEVTSVKMIEEMAPLAVVRTTWSMDWEQEGVGKLPPYFDMIDIWVKSENNRWIILSRVSQVADKPYVAEKEMK